MNFEDYISIIMTKIKCPHSQLSKPMMSCSLPTIIESVTSLCNFTAKSDQKMFIFSQHQGSINF